MRILILIVCLVVAGCPSMPRAPMGVLEQIEASEITAQQLSASVTSLTCTRFSAGKCVEPGKALTPDQGIRMHDQVQEVRGALKTARAISDGKLGECLGQKRSQVSCLAAARAILAQLERQVLEAQGAKP